MLMVPQLKSLMVLQHHNHHKLEHHKTLQLGHHKRHQLGHHKTPQLEHHKQLQPPALVCHVFQAGICCCVVQLCSAVCDCVHCVRELEICHVHGQLCHHGGIHQQPRGRAIQIK